jgi:hypothetical protein
MLLLPVCLVDIAKRYKKFLAAGLLMAGELSSARARSKTFANPSRQHPEPNNFAVAAQTAICEIYFSCFLTFESFKCSKVAAKTERKQKK